MDKFVRDEEFDIYEKAPEKVGYTYKTQMDYLYSKIMKTVIVGVLVFFIFYKFKAFVGIFNTVVAILMPFLIGAGLAFVLNMPMSFFENKVFGRFTHPKFQKFKRPISLLLSLIFFVIFVYFLFSLVVPQLIESAKALEFQIPVLMEKTIEFLSKYKFTAKYAKELQNIYDNFSWNYVFKNVEGFFLRGGNKGSLQNAFNSVTGIAGAVFGWIASALMAFVFCLYMLLDKDKLYRRFTRSAYTIGGERGGNRIIYVSELTNSSFRNFISGQVLDAIIIGALTYIGMLILRLPYAPMISVVVGVSDLVPIVGPIIGALIGFLFILIQSPFKALIYTILVIVLQQIQGNIIHPKIVGDKLGIPAMWSLFATAVGGSLGGVVGMWVFIPAVAIIYRLWGEYMDSKLEREDLEPVLESKKMEIEAEKSIKESNDEDAAI